jgi:NTP pyrophosphatase (non-canonical NTP hydrolase)
MREQIPIFEKGMTNCLGIPVSNIDSYMDYFKRILEYRIQQKGTGGFTSPHEILGVVKEEFDEMAKAVHDNNDEELKKELMDVMVAAMWGYISIDFKNISFQ